MAENGTSPIITEEDLKAAIAKRLQATHVEAEDLSGRCGQSFSVVIVSEQFLNKTSLARNRLVNSALKEEIAAIHSWSAKLYTAEQWEKELKKKTEAGMLMNERIRWDIWKAFVGAFYYMYNA